MVYVPEARKFGFDLKLHEAAMSEVLNSPAVTRLLAQEASSARSQVETHVRSTASSADAENYVAALFTEDSYSDDLGVDLGGPYGLGNRPVAVVGIRSTGARGARRSERVNPHGKPPLMVEADTHALSSVPGFTVGSTGEDIR